MIERAGVARNTNQALRLQFEMKRAKSASIISNTWQLALLLTLGFIGLVYAIASSKDGPPSRADLCDSPYVNNCVENKVKLPDGTSKGILTGNYYNQPNTGATFKNGTEVAYAPCHLGGNFNITQGILAKPATILGQPYTPDTTLGFTYSESDKLVRVNVIANPK